MTSSLDPKESNTAMRTTTGVIDARALRFLVGFIAFAIPIIVTKFFSISLISISASYYVETRDLFVGMTFIVATFLFAYRGCSSIEARFSRIGCAAAIGVALLPTNQPGFPETLISTLHLLSAGILFSVLTIFCLVFFRRNIKRDLRKTAEHARLNPPIENGQNTVAITATGKPQTPRQKMRSTIYLVCGLIMGVCVVGISLAEIFLSEEVLEETRIVYWLEFTALWAFGISWMTTLKPRFLVDSDAEAYKFSLFGR